MPLAGARTHAACGFLIGVALAWVVLPAAAARADEPQQPQSPPPSPPPDADLIEFLGSIGSEDEDWLNYLAQTAPHKAPTPPPSPPPPNGGKNDNE